jgi:Gpi18-like mannosyltransferase
MKSIRNIILIWLAWAILVIAFQAWAVARVVPKFPDYGLTWTVTETGPGYQENQKYLLEPFMNQQVAWDSEYYLAIAVGGYDDPATDVLGPPGHQYTKSYSFLPFYPLLIRLFMFPLKVLGLNPIATATLAGVIVSALGALGAMLALYDITRDSLGEDGGLRAAFYLIIFPTGFFLVQVYTEGVFVGLVFGCIAMLKRKQWLYAALLGSAATLTRAVGVALVIPTLIAWFRSGDWRDLDLEWRQIILQGVAWRSLMRGVFAFAPLITFLVWKFSYYGSAFDYVEQTFFGSTFMNIGRAVQDWTQAFQSLSMQIPQRGANYLIIIVLFLIALVACFKCMKDYPEAAWVSLAIIIISWGSGPASGMHRYVLTTPAIFIALADWGKNPVFDRAWTITSIMWMGFLAAMFAMNLWVA